MKTTKYVGLTALAAMLAVSATANLTSTNYGNFAAQSVDFLSVEEHTSTFGDTVPKYGMPIVNAGSDSMDFNPVGFSAEAGNGDLDYTDGNLVFQIQSRGDAVIEEVGFSEAGFYSLLGAAGTDATHVNVTASFILEVYEINGAPVQHFGNSYSLDFSPGDGTYEKITDGAGTQIAWAGSILVDVDALLAQQGYTVNDHATKVSIDLNNELSAFSEAGTIASIAKKDFDVGVSIEVIPEPASIAMLLGASSLIVLARRRFIS